MSHAIIIARIVNREPQANHYSWQRQSSVDEMMPSMDMVRVTEEAKGGTIEVRVGETVMVELTGNLTTGYHWHLAFMNEKVLSQIGDVEFIPDSDLVGSGGKFRLRFQAARVGRSALKLAYDRDWEKGVPAARQFDILVVVDR